MERLPIEAVQDLIRTTPDFPVIIALYNFNPQVAKELGCAYHPRSSHVRHLIDEQNCLLAEHQLQILRELNARFKFGAPEPLSFPKLVRAYYRSAHNPKCPGYASLKACLKSAARVGSVPAFTLAYNAWIKQYQDLVTAGHIEPLKDPLVNNSWYLDTLENAGAIAYRNHHMVLGEHIYRSFLSNAPIKGKIHKLPYYRSTAHVRQALESYKIRRSRDIRAEHPELFNGDLDDDAKAAIWQTKYSPTLKAIDIETLIPQDVMHRSDILAALAGKLGRPYVGYRKMYVAFASKMYPDKAFARGLGTRQWPISAINAIKHGFYSLGLVFADERSGVNAEVWNGSKSSDLGRFLSKFHFRDFIAIFYRLNRKVTARNIVASESWELYQEYKATYGGLGDDRRDPAYRLPEAKDLSYKLTAKALPIINDILDRVPPEDPNFNQWIVDNWGFLAKIWDTYGRDQFEDSLVYLQVKFGVKMDPNDHGVLYDIIHSGSLGLMAYMLGSKLSHDGRLHPLADPGLMVLHNLDSKFVINQANRMGYPDISVLMTQLG